MRFLLFDYQYFLQSYQKGLYLHTTCIEIVLHKHLIAFKLHKLRQKYRQDDESNSDVMSVLILVGRYEEMEPLWLVVCIYIDKIY